MDQATTVLEEFDRSGFQWSQLVCFPIVPDACEVGQWSGILASFNVSLSKNRRSFFLVSLINISYKVWIMPMTPRNDWRDENVLCYLFFERFTVILACVGSQAEYFCEGCPLLPNFGSTRSRTCSQDVTSGKLHKLAVIEP